MPVVLVLLFGWNQQIKLNSALVRIYEYGNGSNSTAEINWIALQSALKGAQLGTTSMDSWNTGIECKKIDFLQVRSILL